MQVDKRRGSTYGNEYYQPFGAKETFPSKQRKGSFASSYAENSKVYQPASRYHGSFKGRSQKERAEEAWDERREESDCEYRKVDLNKTTSSVSHATTKDEAVSTDSSDGQSKSRETDRTVLDDFKVSVLDEVIDGIKFREQLHLRFAAASLCHPPEASQLLMPTDLI